MKTSSEFSLNDNLLPGANPQQELFLILLKFRTYKYVIRADIEKMFRHIFVSQEHRKLQLIFWRENINDPLKVYELLTVTYGTVPAPFLAMRCLKQLAMENMNKLPSAALNVLNNFYMDDLICGEDALEATLKLSIGILNQHKWASNERTLLPE